MAMADLSDWMTDFARRYAIWYVKRLAANDTLATRAHQAGPYIPKDFFFGVFPALNRPDTENPDVWFDLHIDSHADRCRVRAVWYNNRLRGGTRNEAHLTKFGGQTSALLDADSTGALTIFAFVPSPGGRERECHVWLCASAQEEDLAEDRLGPVEPGRFLIWSPHHELTPDLFAVPVATDRGCRLSSEQIPPRGSKHF